MTQREEITGYIRSRYGSEPEYMWQSTPDAAVFRHSDNRKWFGLIMCIPREKLGISGAKTDIINVKCDQLMVGSFLLMDGYYPAYHMNKKSWLTIILDGTIDMDQIKSMVDMSYAITQSKEKKAESAGRKEWLIPANPRIYDLEAAFQRSSEIMWHHSHSIKAGDTVYIYVGAPLSAVMYRCIVEETGILFSFSGDGKNIRDAMKLRLEHTYIKNELGLGLLRELGVYSVRNARGVPYELSEYISHITDKNSDD